MYYGAHSIRFYPNESWVGEFTFAEATALDFCPDTWKTWHLIPIEKVIFKPPEVEDGMLKIPGRNGLVNVNKYTTGKSVFGARIGTIDFAVDPDYIEDWPAIYSDILRYFHGKERCAVLRDDRYYYYKGWFTVSDLQPGETWDTVTLSYQLEPFKYERWASDEQMWYWDDFDFRQGTIREYWDVAVETTNYPRMELVINAKYPFGEDVIPKFKALNRDDIESDLAGLLRPVINAVGQLPIKWGNSFSGAYVEWPDSPSYPADHSNQSNWLTAYSQMMTPGDATGGKIKALKDATDAIPLNTDLQSAATEAVNVLSELYTIATRTASTSAEQEVRKQDFLQLLPEAAELLDTIIKSAGEGVVQASSDGVVWKNVFSYNAVQKPEIHLNKRDPYDTDPSEFDDMTDEEIGHPNTVVLYLRPTIDTRLMNIVPHISISIRGNTL